MVLLNFWLVVIPAERFLARGGSWWLVVARGGLWWFVCCFMFDHRGRYTEEVIIVNKLLHL